MDRRAFLGALGLLGVPRAIGAQSMQGRAKIGALFSTGQAGAAINLDAFRQGMQDLGYVDGRTFVLETRYADARLERLPELARELVSLKPHVIVATTDQAVAAVKKHTSTIPIVMTNVVDPVGTGLVASLARPGGNVTGLSLAAGPLSGKRLQLLKEVVPGLSRVAFLWNPDVRGAVLDYKELEGAVQALRLQLQSVEISRTEDVDHAFRTMTANQAQAFVCQGPNPVLAFNRARIVSFAQKSRLPGMYVQRAFVEAGGLMSYGPFVPDLSRRAATYVDKILKGAKPADLPIEQPTKFELVINLKTAKALGLTIPPALLQRADQVIE